MSVWIGRALAAAIGLTAALAVSVAAHSEPVKIRISWVAIPNDLPPLFMEKPELMTRAGQSYVVDAIRFPDTPQSIAALASGDLDIALLTFSSFPLAIQNAKLDDLRVIADEYADGGPGHYSTEFLVLKDAPIKTIADLKGRSVAVKARGGSADMALRAITRRQKLEEKRDFTQVEVPSDGMKAGLLQKTVDVVSVGRPAISADPVLREAARQLFTQRDALGPTAQVIWVAREGFLQRNRSVMVEFMADALRFRRYVTDPKNHREAVDMVSRVAKQPAPQFEGWLFSANDFYRPPGGVLDEDILRENIGKMLQLGFLKTAIDVKKHQDYSIVKDAADKLK